MATRELRKKRGAVNPSPVRRTGPKQKDEKTSVKTVFPSRTDKTETIISETEEEDGSPAVQEENTKDTGQEKDKGIPEPKVPGVLDSPRYTRTLRERERSASPFRRNVVQPLPGTSGEGSNMGSTTSVRSHASSKEFRPEQSSRPSSSSSNKEHKRGRTNKVDTISIKTDASERHDQNAYIPYAYARDSIARMVGDMTSMKTKHVHIVKEIEKHYRAIEDETQVQFNGFVFMLRQQYTGKVATFRQVIELHRTELQQKEHYWTENLESLTERVNRLLKDRKILLISNREEVDKVEKEKALLLTQLTTQMDHEKSNAVKDFEKRLKEQDDKIGSLEAEKKRMQDELESEKKEVIRLRDLVAVGAGGTIIGAAAVAAADKNAKKEKATILMAVPPGGDKEGVSEEERQRMSDERQQMTADMNRTSEERQDLMDKVKELQADVARLSLESAEWQEKYRLLIIQAGDTGKLREQYARLESQYNALALVVKTTPESSEAAGEKMSQVDEEKAMMEAERQRLAKEIEKWEKEFKKKNKRDPTDQDKPDSSKELYVQMEEVTQMVDSLDRQKETLKAVQSGTVPPTPDLPPLPVKEPEVTVVEVKVPDPDIVASLERSQAAVDDLQSRLAALQEENADLRAQIAGLQAGVSMSVAGGAVLSNDSERVESLTAELNDKEKELEALRAEKREMAKDMKKMFRQHAKLQAKMGETDLDLPRVLQMIAVLVQSIHNDYPGAAKAVEQRLAQAETAVKSLKKKESSDKKALHAWDKKYKKTHGTSPEDSDRDEESQTLKASADDSSKALDIKQVEIRALKILHTGIFKSEELQRPKSASTREPKVDVDQQLSELDNKIIDLEGEREKLQGENTKLQASVEDMEQQIADLKEQLALQATVGVGVAALGSQEEMSDLQHEVDDLSAALQQERAAHDATREELESVQKQLQTAQDELTVLRGETAASVQKATAVLEAMLASKEEQLSDAKKRVDELEKERLANVPLDTAKEIKNLQNKISVLEKEKEQLNTSVAGQGAAVEELQFKLNAANKAIEAQRAANREMEGRVKAARADKEKAIKELTNQVDKKEQQRAALETKLKQLQASGAVAAAAAVRTGGKSAAGTKGASAGEDTAALKHEIRELNARIKQLEMDARRGAVAGVAVGAAGDAASDRNVQKRHEKILKELAKKYEIEQNRTAKLTESVKEKDVELKALHKDVSEKEAELVTLRGELALLGAAAKEGVEAAGKVKALETENKKLLEENKLLTENYNSERVLRKKYYNMVEDMKGKIRVYCRARPLSTSEKSRGNFSVLKSPDEYSLQVDSQRGLKEFQYDQIFMEDSSQEKIFEDTNNLIQSAVDGYNVCIFAYGQTGSGKTFTMIGDREGQFPGIAPRAFKRIFEMAEENKAKFDLQVTTYMLELYNEKLIDLFARPENYDEDKLDIKKDKKGMVFVHGAVVKPATNAKELTALFEEGSKNRHTAATKMNAESSRSHLVIGIVLESTSKATGTVMKGKLSLVDLAGSERVGKTGATAEQLKEAMSINKSLSALGDVISALSSEQSFIPYRNNKLTMLMQDSLGGNAKTLMFVNISPADYNVDETVVSLTYASRVKLITNDASKNADNKEINRLKGIIAKLKAGERVDEED